MSDLVEFLRTRIAEGFDNVRSLAANFDPGDEEMWTEYSAAEALIVELHASPHPCPGNAEHAQPPDRPYVGCDTIRLLAFDYRDEPEFRDEWLPTELPRIVRTDAPHGDT